MVLRTWKYVGAQPEKIREAQESVNRYHEAQELKRALEQHQRKISAAGYELEGIARTLNRNW